MGQTETHPDKYESLVLFWLFLFGEEQVQLRRNLLNIV